MKKIQTLVALFKINLGRAGTYIGIFNSGALLFLVLDKAASYGIRFPIGTSIFSAVLALVIWTLLLQFIGWADTKFGFYRKETEIVSKQNPYFDRILNNIKELHEKINKLEMKLNENK